jgi:predicted AAA+ superfamily ATPase
MSYIKRDIEKTIQNAAKYYSAIIITGPRQVGKTTMLKEIAKKEKTERRYVTLDDLEARKLASSSPETFLTLNPPPILIDEVQYAPELFSYIKIAVDNGAKPSSFWLTGSQSFRLMELAKESLAGRAAVFSMPSLSAHEIFAKGEITPFSMSLESLQRRVATARATDINGVFERIWNGSMPGFISGKYPDRELFYSSYLSTYVSRDIGDMVNNINTYAFTDFIRAAACRICQVLNVHDIAADVGVSDETAKRWLSLLERSGIIYYLHPFSNNLLKRTISQPNLYFFDTGLVAYLTKYSTPEVLQNGALNGAILENYVISEILKSYSNCGRECLAHYYRDKDGKEIDLILESDGELHPIEIKKTASPPSGVTTAFKTLDVSSIKRGTGVLISTTNELSAVDSDNFILPVWAV